MLRPYLTILPDTSIMHPSPMGGGKREEHTMHEQKQQLLNRLKTVEGHVRGVQRMIEDDAYCIDILKQTQAIQRALEKFNSLILWHQRCAGAGAGRCRHRD